MVIALFCNFTIDIVCLNGIAKIQIGGPAYYASLALNFMGEKSTLYTAIGKGIQKKKLKMLQRTNINLENIAFIDELPTPLFIHICWDDKRKSYIYNETKLDEYYQNVKINEKDIYVSFTFREVKEDILYKLTQNKNCFLDMQGFLRYRNRYGLIKHKEPSIALDNFRYIKVSEEEIPNLKNLLQRAFSCSVEEVIVTRGARGVHVYSRKGIVYKLDLLNKNNNMRDPTGAGDVFGAIYFATRTNGASIPESIMKASLFASLKVNLGEHFGKRTIKNIMQLSKRQAFQKIKIDDFLI
ncbi:hypothetical protein B9Q11_02820 [Candidatus Marsarchaeota G2 archaeon ECH_B_SAG-F08]|uniref:Carbohydrate kinase PfkB domain-containing protein n=1 Tax=Candidatus Marsarchaeota G2 archaeon ECH_B_SAG-F08 TaxID=1978165 RepID=A0A2R6BHM4_9ARCH|nr:MAG: hypothetical protein B9Q11_02820 [Candidatus Marsarchaeota G2 archaeon ECH_B_SAG-F08]